MALKGISRSYPVTSRDGFEPALQTLDTVQAVSLQYKHPEDGYVHAPKRIGLVNSRTGELISVASDRWKPINHADAFRTVIENVDALVGTKYTGTVFNNGNNASMSLLFGEVDLSYDAIRHAVANGELHKGDPLAYGVRVSNRYQVGTVFKVESMFVRLACTNGMICSDVSASTFLNHVDTMWNNEIAGGVADVVGRLSNATELVGSRIHDARQDCVNYSEYEREIKDIGEYYTSGQGWKKLMKSSYGWKGDQQFSRYDLYNMLTAYSTHLQPSQLKFEAVQKGAQYVLKTPFDILFQEVAERLLNPELDPSAGVATS